MTKKNRRWEKIRGYLAESKTPMMITEIYQKIILSVGDKVSRKTIQRDMEEMIEERIVIQIEDSPLRFRLAPVLKARIEIEREEAKVLMELLGPDSILYKKIKVAFKGEL